MFDIKIVISGTIGKTSIAYDITEDLNVSQDIALGLFKKHPLFNIFIFTIQMGISTNF